MIASADELVLHAGWDLPDYRWYDLEGLPVNATTSGNDLLIERECSAVSLAAAALSIAHWREFRCAAEGDWAMAGRAISAAMEAAGLRNIWTPYARFEQVVQI